MNVHQIWVCIVVLLLGCAEEPERTVSTNEDDPYGDGDSTGDGDRGDGDGDNGDGDGDNGDGDGDAGSGGAGGGGSRDGGGDGDGDSGVATTGVIGPLSYEIIPKASGTDVLMPVAISDEGHVLFQGVLGSDVNSFYVWRGGPNEPAKLEIPAGYTVIRTNGNGCLLSGDRVVVALAKGGIEVLVVLQGDAIEELPIDAGVTRVNVVACNEAGQVLALAARLNSRDLWLVSTDGTSPQDVYSGQVVGMNEAGVVGFADTYWQGGALLADYFAEFEFTAVSGPSATRTMLGYVQAGSRQAPSILAIATGEVAPVAPLQDVKAGPEAAWMLENGDYIVGATVSSPLRDVLLLFHDGSYTMLEPGGITASSVIESNSHSDVLVRLPGRDHVAAVLKLRD